MSSNFSEPINIGSEEMVTIDQLIEITSAVANKNVRKQYKLDAPVGVRGRNSDNNLIRSVLGWDYEMTLKEGISNTYHWINAQVSNKLAD